MSDSLAQIYERHRVYGPDVGMGDKGGTHSYIEEYERLLAPYRAKSAENPGELNFMEIGLAMGLSLEMWREYLPEANIIGVDLSIAFDRQPHAMASNVLIEADATKPEFLDKLDGYTFDVVIDDGSHRHQDQMATFKLLEPRMRAGSIYIIEDIISPEAALPDLKTLHRNIEVIDLRSKKDRFDDMLVVIRFP